MCKTNQKGSRKVGDFVGKGGAARDTELVTTRRRLLALFLAVLTVFSLLSTSAFAAQEDNYHDPAEHWLTASNRTNELDANAVVTHETFTCAVCGKGTSSLVFRTPEYTRNGQTAMSRNVGFSDGTLIGGSGAGAVMDGTPGKDAYYTGYHWTKAVCESCGSTNSNMGATNYSFNKNVYWLYDCAAEFTEELPETIAYEYADSAYHTRITKSGTYCCFCFGTHKTETTALERHNLQRSVTAQLANQRFVEKSACALCDYEKTSYAAAKSVVADYYGVADGQPHTLTVTDLSESGVRTQIRYGNSADSCTLTSAPSYIAEGQYTVYYEITYTYQNTDMVENGVAYVWLRDETTDESGSCACGCGDPNCGCQNKDCNGDCCGDKGCGENHHFILLDSTQASCLTLGYDRYLCTECGKIEKRDYTAALGHAWQGVVVREATCETDGKRMELCSRCGQVKVTDTPRGEHEYETHTVTPTCVSPGYTARECAVCGDRHIEDIASALPHNYVSYVTPATCEGGGKTIHRCDGCGSGFTTDYTVPLGHSWDGGTIVTGATCTGEGVMEYRCIRCGSHRLEGDAAIGHVPGDPATCTEPQLCTRCGAVIQAALGHDYKGKITAPTCTEMGFTTFTCSRCGDTYKGEYTRAAGHKPGDWIIDREPTTANQGSKHRTCTVCGEKLDAAAIEKIYNQAATDSKGEAVVGGYLVIVTDTNTRNPVAGATVTLNKDDTLSIRLPGGRLLDYDGQTTVTVLLVKDKSAVANMEIAVTDKNANYCAEKTNKVGRITVPGTSGKTNGDGSITIGGKDEDGDRFTLTVTVEDYETRRLIKDAAVTIGKTGKITVTLPDGTDMDEKNRITVTVTDHRKKPQADRAVTVKNDLGGKESGQTDEDGRLTVPAVEETERHGVFIYGYTDGTFGPERGMTRSEAAAIFARLLAEKKGDAIPSAATTKFTDIPSSAWYSGYVKYLTGYGVVYGRGGRTFAPDAAITRAEFVAFSARFFDAYGDGNAEIMEQYAGFDDVSDGYWAAEYIRDAALHGWVQGYGDGTFRADDTITRAEVVTIVNRLLGRVADREYIANHLRKLNTFSDMSRRHWAYYAVMEAANAHTATLDDTESWSK